MIAVDNVSIGYLTGSFKDIGFKDYIVQKLTGKYEKDYFWAVNDVNFKLEKGELLGIIGRNGSGKSTLLKALTLIMRPVKGSVHVDGKIAALLELGTGFDGELTVRENTFLRGALLGYTKDFLIEKYDDIIAFAELEEFQDRPFKQLSSGMKSRLAFSISCLVNPDVLILDEVLSVGDGAFRSKSEARMKELMAKGSTTILVSHSLAQIKKLSTKVLWLEKGKQMAFGDTKEVCAEYEKFIASLKK